MNSEKANVTFERPLYLLTLEEKVGREKEQLTFLLISPQGGVALNSAEESWLSWDLPVAIVLAKGLRMVEMTKDTRVGRVFWVLCPVGQLCIHTR